MTQAPSTAHQDMWSDVYRAALHDRAEEWMDLGAIVLPVIPIALPADRWHKINKIEL